MANIFEIGDHLKAIIDELEENGGELTEELAAELEITQENFNDKVESYCQLITMYKSNIDCCKEEKSRINTIQKVKENIVDKIKLRLLDAVKLYGSTGKSGNKVVELPTRKLYTKNTESVQENENRIDILKKYFIEYIEELQNQGILELGETIDVNGLLAAVNAIIKADYDRYVNEFDDESGFTPPVEEFVPYTLADLQAINVEFKQSISIYNLITSYSNIGYLIASDQVIPSGVSINKDVAKAILKDDDSRLTVGELINKDSLIIK